MDYLASWKVVSPLALDANSVKGLVAGSPHIAHLHAQLGHIQPHDPMTRRHSFHAKMQMLLGFQLRFQSRATEELLRVWST